MKATLKIISNDGQTATFRDLTNGQDGILRRAGSTVADFLHDLAPGQILEATCRSARKIEEITSHAQATELN